jgi:subtilisin family serine protease
MYFIDSGVSSSDINVKGRFDLTHCGLDDEEVFVDVDCTIEEGGPDTNGHGTHLAAVASAVDDRDGVVGVAPGVDVYSLKVIRDDGTAESAFVISALDFIVARKQARPGTPMVANISLGADIETTEYIALDEAVDAAAKAGVIVVVSAGNGGVDASTYTPAHARGAITVGSYGKNYQFSSFSNHGSVVDILAPGEGLETIGSDVAPGGARPSTTTGTSPAAAIAAGAAAVYLAEHPTATAQEVERELAGGRRTVRRAPNGTTDRSVWIGDSAQNVNPEKPGKPDVSDRGRRGRANAARR